MELFFKKIGLGKPIFILHGLFGLGDNWATISKSLSENGFACYVVDQRNHGRSGHTMEMSYELMAADLAGLMDAENISKADIIGHSMGGKTAMFFARDFTERVNKMIVADMSPRFYPPHHQSIFAALNSVDTNALTSRKDAELILRQSLREESTIQFLLKNLYWNESEKLEWRFGLKEIESNIEEVGKEFTSQKAIDIDILFLRGERSGYIREEDIPVIKKIFPLAKIDTIPNAGHWLHAEKPEEFLEKCIMFLVKEV